MIDYISITVEPDVICAKYDTPCPGMDGTHRHNVNIIRQLRIKVQNNGEVFTDVSLFKEDHMKSNFDRIIDEAASRLKTMIMDSNT